MRSDGTYRSWRDAGLVDGRAKRARKSFQSDGRARLARRVSGRDSDIVNARNNNNAFKGLLSNIVQLDFKRMLGKRNSQLRQHVRDLRWLGTPAIIGIDKRVSDHAAAIDDERRGESDECCLGKRHIKSEVAIDSG